MQNRVMAYIEPVMNTIWHPKTTEPEEICEAIQVVAPETCTASGPDDCLVLIEAVVRLRYARVNNSNNLRATKHTPSCMTLCRAGGLCRDICVYNSVRPGRT